MKKILLLLILFSYSYLSFSQQDNTKTVLFLIPFFADRTNEINLSKIITDEDIYAVTPFQLVGFWEGASLALTEFEQGNTSFNIIVKDITNDSTKLCKILQDTVLMEKVDLIIGPFFSDMFEIAATYAAQYKTPIVNPFSTRTDFVKGNEYVYKLMPGRKDATKIIMDYIAKTDVITDIYIWSEDEDAMEVKKHIDYFTRDSIPFTSVKFESGITNLTSKFKKNHRSLVIVSASSQSRIINNLRLLERGAHLPHFDLVIPESWLEKNLTEIESFNKLEVLFISDYYVDYKHEKTLYFTGEFIERYASPPDLKRFSFQGYDITKYLITALINDFDTTRFSFEPLSLDIRFEKSEEGGYENQGKRLLRLKNFEIIEAGGTKNP